MNRIICVRCFSHQFKNLRRNWRLDLEVAAVYESMNIKNYFSRNRDSNFDFEDLTATQLEALSDSRQEEHNEEISRILNESALDGGQEGINSANEFLEGVREIEQNHFIGYDAEAANYFNDIGIWKICLKKKINSKVLKFK